MKISEALSAMWDGSRNSTLEELEERLLEWERNHTTSKDRYQLLLDMRTMLKEMRP